MVEAGAPQRVRVLTSDYLDITDPEALRLLLLLQERGAEVRVYTTQEGSFHLKADIFAKLDGQLLAAGTAFVGSGNISRQAQQDGLEWNYRVVYPGDSGFLEARHRFDEWFGHPKTVALSDAWIEAYEQRRLPPSRSIAPGSHEQEAPPEPTQIQHEALAALTASREGGYRRLLGHVAPSFLLGLTATADRTDPSDILLLRDDNLVYRCHLFAGIQAAG